MAIRRLMGILFLTILTSCGEEEEKMDLRARADRDALLVEVYVAEKGNWDKMVESTGTFLPFKQIKIRSEVNGRVVSLNYKEGMEVTKGQLLIKMDDKVLQAQKEQLEVEVKWLKSQHERNLKLLESEAISEQEMEKVFSELETKKAQLEGVKAQISLTNIIAPFTGRVGLSDLEKGAYLDAGEMITTLTIDEMLKLDFAVPEFYASQVNIDDDVNFTVMGSKDTLKATVYAREAAIDESSRMLNVRAVFANESKNILPGTYANVQVDLKNNLPGLMVPSESIEPQLSGEEVYVVKSGKVEKRSVITGKRNEKYVQVIEGLNPGDTVLVTGLLSAKVGIEVEIKNVVNR